MKFDIYIKGNICICPLCGSQIKTFGFIETIYCPSCKNYFKMNNSSYQYNDHLFEFTRKEK